MARLNIYPKDGDIFQFSLIGEKVSVGRFSDNDIILPDPFCSAHHAFFYLDDDGYVIRDINSINGTILNNMPISSKAKLRCGDEIVTGTTRIVYDIEMYTEYR